MAARRKPVEISKLVQSFAADEANRASFAAAVSRVATETPEEAQAALAADEREARLQWLAIQSQNRRSRYEESRPAEYANASLERLLPQQDDQGKGRGWLTSKAKVGLFCGPSGHGKTALAYAIGNAAIDTGLWVEAWHVTELVQALAPLPFHARRDEARSARQENILSWAKECDLLILDDLGAEEGGGFVAERWRAQLLEILTARDGESRFRTIVTANGGETAGLTQLEAQAVKVAAAQRIADRYDARVATRLRRDFLGIWVEGECLRKPAAWNPF